MSAIARLKSCPTSKVRVSLFSIASSNASTFKVLAVVVQGGGNDLGQFGLQFFKLSDLPGDRPAASPPLEKRSLRTAPGAGQRIVSRPSKRERPPTGSLPRSAYANLKSAVVNRDESMVQPLLCRCLNLNACRIRIPGRKILTA